MFDDMFEDDDELLDDAGGDDSSGATGGLSPPRENTEMIGAEGIEKTLLELYNNKTLPHALIFAGPQGVGKTTMAFRFARFLLKHGAGDDDQGGLFGDAPPEPTTMTVSPDDPVFRKVASGGHPDLRYLERPVERGIRKSVVDVDTVREIAPFLRKTTAEGGWRVVILDEADLMNRQAQNAVLKILEEPPPKAMLILICNRLGAMIPTIRSRCRTLHFAPLPKDTLEKLLMRAAPEARPAEISLLSALSDGSIGRAVQLHEEGGIGTLQTLIDLLGGWPDWDWPKIHPMADNLSRNDAEKGYEAFAALVEWTAQSLLKARAVGLHTLPEILKTERLLVLLNHYSLEQWIDICEKLKGHFIAINNSNLDKRQGVIGAFAILGGQL
jgi:DNA polymerase-3 subunit delta'